MTYLFDNQWPEAKERLEGLEAVEDTDTFALLDAVAVAPGWRCLEVGAGAGSVARWLSARVGASGRVVATDIDTRLLAQLACKPLEVRQHDLESAPLERSAFDLVHLRHVLFHVPAERHAACLENLVACLASGGVMLVEESDFGSVCAEPGTNEAKRLCYETVTSRIQELYLARGLDVHVGSKLLGMLQDAGLADCHSASRKRCIRGGSPEADFHKRTYLQLRETALASGLLSRSDYDRFLALHDDRQFALQTRTTVAAWGFGAV